MFDSHDDDLWEVPSIDVDAPVEAAAPVEAPAAEVVAAAPESVAAAAVEAAVPAEAAVNAEDESSTDGYDQAEAEAPRTTATTWMGWTASCSSTLLARSCAKT